MTAPVHPAGPGELADWDAHTVRPPGGHVLQSLAWATHRAATGQRAHFLVTADGGRVLVLERPWPLLPGGRGYVSRGPAPVVAPEAAAARLVAVTGWLGSHGFDVVVADPEIPAASSYVEAIRAAGFGPVEEIQAARHTMRLALGPGVDDAAAWSGVTRSTRQRVRQAETSVSVVHHDGRAAGDEPAAPAGLAAPSEPAETALDRFYDMLTETGERVGFTLASRASAVGWWVTAYRAGWLIYLEARVDDEPAGGLALYRHGGRLATFVSGDRTAVRRAHPGIMHLLRWRAIQLAIAEGCPEIDLGGVDVAGARGRPGPGDPTFGLYEHKRSFGAEWVELAGAHRRVLSPARHELGRVLSRGGRVLSRAAGALGGAR